MLGLTIPVSSVPVSPRTKHERGKFSTGSHALRVYFTPLLGQEIDGEAPDEVRFDNRRLARLLLNRPGSQTAIIPVGLPKPCLSHPHHKEGIRHGWGGLFLQNAHIIPSRTPEKQFLPDFPHSTLTRHAPHYSLQSCRIAPFSLI